MSLIPPPSARLIPLTQGFFAIVDAEDFDRLSKFKWRVRKYKKYPQLVYAVRSVRLPSGGSSTIYMHREILGATPGTLVDHKNRNGVDNRSSNLRFCSQSENNANSRKRQNAKSSALKGIYWHQEQEMWMARIQFQNKQYWLGRFKKEADAHKAYAAAANKFFGDYARP